MSYTILTPAQLNAMTPTTKGNITSKRRILVQPGTNGTSDIYLLLWCQMPTPDEVKAGTHVRDEPKNYSNFGLRQLMGLHDWVQKSLNGTLVDTVDPVTGLVIPAKLPQSWDTPEKRIARMSLYGHNIAVFNLIKPRIVSAAGQVLADNAGKFAIKYVAESDDLHLLVLDPAMLPCADVVVESALS